jgi:hypothetical protein
LMNRGFEVQVFKACHEMQRPRRMDMTSCFASDLFPYGSILLLIPQYDVHYRFSSRNSLFCVRCSSRSWNQSHEISTAPFRLVFVGLASSGPIIHPLRNVLVDITKKHMIRRKNKPIANEGDSRYGEIRAPGTILRSINSLNKRKFIWSSFKFLPPLR